MPDSSDIIKTEYPWKLPTIDELKVKHLSENKNDAASVAKLVKDERIRREKMFYETGFEGDAHAKNKESKQKTIAKKKVESSNAFHSEKLAYHYIEAMKDLQQEFL